MDILRKLLPTSRGGADGRGQEQDTSELQLQLLKKRFLHYVVSHKEGPSLKSSHELYLMLPLFSRVFSKPHNPQLESQFSECRQFAGHMAKLFVTEVGMCTTTDNLPENATSIFQYLSSKSETRHGQNLLSTLGILSNCSSSVVQCLSAAHLPSRTLRCLRNLLVLPSTVVNSVDPGTLSFVQNSLVVISSKLFLHDCALEDAMDNKEVHQLVVLACSPVPKANLGWRAAMASTLLVITRQSFNLEVLQHMKAAKTLKAVIDVLGSFTDADMLDVPGRLEPLIYLLKAASSISSAMMESFEELHGYDLISKLLKSAGNLPPEHAGDLTKQLLLLVSSLIYNGDDDSLELLQEPLTYTDDGPPHHESIVSGVPLKNVKVCKVLVEVFIESVSEHLCTSIISTFRNMLVSDSTNYRALVFENLLSKMVESMCFKPLIVQKKMLSLIRLIPSQLRVIPERELFALGLVLHNPCSSDDCLLATVKTLQKLLTYSQKFFDVFRSNSILDTLGDLFMATCRRKRERKELGMDWPGYFAVLHKCLVILLTRSHANCSQFRKLFATNLQRMILENDHRDAALQLTEQLIKDHGTEDITQLLIMMQSAPVEDIQLRVSVLSTILRAMELEPRCRRSFCEVSGFVNVLSMLVNMEGSLQANPPERWHLENRADILSLIDSIFVVLKIAFQDDPSTRLEFRDEARCQSLAEVIWLLGCFGPASAHLRMVEPTNHRRDSDGQSKEFVFSEVLVEPAIFCKRIIDNLFRIALLEHSPNHQHSVTYVVQPAAVSILIYLLPSLEAETGVHHLQQNYQELQLYIMKRLRDLCKVEFNQHVLSDFGLLPLLLHTCAAGFAFEQHTLHGSLTVLFDKLSSQHISSNCLRILFRLGCPLASKSSLALTKLNPNFKESSDAVTMNENFIVLIRENRLVCVHPIESAQSEENEIDSADSSSINFDHNQFPTTDAESLDFVAAKEESIDIKAVQTLQVSQPRRGSYNSIESETSLNDMDPAGADRPPTLVPTVVVCPRQNSVETLQEDGVSQDAQALLAQEPFSWARQAWRCDHWRCIEELDQSLEGKPVPSERMKCLISLVSMSQSEDTCTDNISGVVEFNMDVDGFGFLYIPLLSFSDSRGPSSSIASHVVRPSPTSYIFPPAYVLSYSVWINLCSTGATEGHGTYEAHPLCLLHLEASQQHPSHTSTASILSVLMDVTRHELVVITEQVHSDKHMLDVTNPHAARFAYAKAIVTGVWTHLCFVFQKAYLLRGNSVTVYVNGVSLGSAKTKYFAPNLVEGCRNTINAYIGSPLRDRRWSNLVWRLSSCMLVEELLSDATIAVIYSLGPGYRGNLQAALKSGGTRAEYHPPLVSEEKIILNLVPSSSLVTTVEGLFAEGMTPEDFEPISDICNLQIGQAQFGLTFGKSSPVTLVENAAHNLPGFPRACGAVIVGTLGVRVYSLQTAPTALSALGGVSVSLALVAMSESLDSLYASFKALSCLLKASPLAVDDMISKKGYKILGYLLRSKRLLLNRHVLNLVYDVCGVLDIDTGLKAVSHRKAVKHILCNLQIWQDLPHDMERSLYGHLVDLLEGYSDPSILLSIMHRCNMVLKLMMVLERGEVLPDTQEQISHILLVMLRSCSEKELAQFGLFLLLTLPSTGEEVSMDQNPYPAKLKLRMILLSILQKAFYQNGKINQSFVQLFISTLGTEWFLHFLQPRILPDCCSLVLRLLVDILLQPLFLQRFCSPATNSSWQKDIEATFHTSSSSGGLPLKPDSTTRESPAWTGPQLLKALLPGSQSTTERYPLLFCLLLGVPTSKLSEFAVIQVDLFKRFILEDQKQTSWWGRPLPVSQNRLYCPDAASTIIKCCAVSAMSLADPRSERKKATDVIILTQVMDLLLHIYINIPMSSAILCSLENIKNLQRVVGCSFGQSPNTDTSSTPDYLSSVVDLLVKITHDHVFSSRMAASVSPLEVENKRLTQQQMTLMESAVITGLLSEMSAKVDVVLQTLSSMPRLVPQFQALMTKLSDKIWAGVYRGSWRPYFIFYKVLLENTKDPLLVDTAYKQFRRVVLFYLATAPVKPSEKSNILEFLHTLCGHLKFLTASSSQDVTFVHLVTYLLLSLESGVDSQAHDDRKDQDQEDPDGSSISKLISLHLEPSLERLWSLFYAEKREVIHELRFYAADSETSRLSQRSAAPKEISLEHARKLYMETAALLWLSYHDEEVKHATSTPLASAATEAPTTAVNFRRKSKLVSTKNDAKTKTVLQHLSRIMMLARRCMRVSIDRLNQDLLVAHKTTAEMWRNMEQELIRERGLWGPSLPSKLDRSMLSAALGPNRMRRRLQLNEQFYNHYPYENVNLDVSVPRQRCKPFSYLSVEHHKELMYYLRKLYNNDNEDKVNFTELHLYPTIHPAVELTKSRFSFATESALELIECSERITAVYRCARVQGIDTTEGLLIFGHDHLYVVDGLTLLSNNEICDIASLHPNTHQPLIPTEFSGFSSTWTPMLLKMNYQSLAEVSKARHLLKDTALELVFSDGLSLFLVVLKSKLDKIYNWLVKIKTDNKMSLPPGSKPDAEESVGILGNWIGDRSVTQRWVRREISNFQYLMYLNVQAGRSYNDLMQYPVFPWILADYDSVELDLGNPATFRDLSKPMGAQSEERLSHFIKRYEEFEDPTGENPHVFYGTFYSTAMIVASYLIRLEPFSQHFLHLQGGYFDLPDRLFHSIKDSWLSSSHNNMSDVKELIPEFFYLPEFLCNRNKFYLGTKQNGEDVNDVVLPPWAKGDPREFIRVHRMALESEHVGAHLHEWIDLVFGYKQRGAEAIASHNLFHSWCYEGGVDVDAVDDPQMKKAIHEYINNFGQVPKQLFKKPHPCRKPSQLPCLIDLGHGRTIPRSFRALTSSTVPVKTLNGAVGEIMVTDRGLLAVTKNKVFIHPSLSKVFGWGFGDQSFRITAYGNESGKPMSITENLHVGKTLCAVAMNDSAIFTAGSSSVVCCWKQILDKDRVPRLSLHKSLVGHYAAVRCMAVLSEYNLLVSGSEDCSCIMWDLETLQFVRQLDRHDGPVTCVAVSKISGTIVSCTRSTVYVWSINGDLIVQGSLSTLTSYSITCVALCELEEWHPDNLIITGTTSGSLMFWRQRYIEVSVNQSLDAHLDKVGMTTSSTSSRKLSSSGSCSDFVMVTGEDGAPKRLSGSNPDVFWVNTLEVCHRTKLERNNLPAAITAIALSSDKTRLLAGYSNGAVYSWSAPDESGKAADHWVKDEQVDSCTNCGVKFSFSERRHHCRNCGLIFCSRCSRFESSISRLNIRQPVRVCQLCYPRLNPS